MAPFAFVRLLLRITRSHGIVRRYFVVNGFDGALTMLGIVSGFALGAPAELSVVINAGLGAAIALGVSGASSAYISESAERRRDLGRLEGAMLADLEGSFHALAAVWVPPFIALVNGAAPLLLGLLILCPLWLAGLGVALPLTPLGTAIAVALSVVFLLGVFLGRIAGVTWWWSGVKALAIALLTVTLIGLVAEP